MRALNIAEIDQIVESLGAFVGSELQNVIVGENGVGLGFWTIHQEVSWLWFENHHWFPLVIPLNQSPERSIRPRRPLELFLEAHFIRSKLVSCVRVKEHGRALRLALEGASFKGQIEIRLWPTGGNCIASTSSKRVALSRVLEVAVSPTSEGKGSPLEKRSLEELLGDWEQLRSLRKKTGKSLTSKNEPKAEVQPEDIRRQQVARIERALEKVKGDLKNKTDLPWRSLGEALVSRQKFVEELAMAPFLDRRRSLAWNIENCFAQAKTIEQKIELTTQRLKLLESEIAWWKSADPKDFPQAKSSARDSKKNKAHETKFRSLEIDATHSAKVGKSGKDNIALLRSAHPWDYWLHLKDYPGSHAILPRQKNEKISDSAFRKVGLGLIENSKGNKKSSWAGVKVELIIVECRFVRPIKGDRLGRVHYSNEKILTIRIE